MVNHKGKSYTCVNVQKGGDHEGRGFSKMLRGVQVQEMCGRGYKWRREILDKL